MASIDNNVVVNEKSDTDDFQVNTLVSANQIRRTYLITFSQGGLRIFPTRQSFGEQVSTYFNEGTGKVKVEHWACCQEPHENSGVHYHMSLKVSGAKSICNKARYPSLFKSHSPQPEQNRFSKN